MSTSCNTCAGYCGHSEEQSRVSSLDITETGSKEGARALLSDMDWLVSGDRENFPREFIGWHLKDWGKNGPEEKVELGLGNPGRQGMSRGGLERHIPKPTSRLMESKKKSVPTAISIAPSEVDKIAIITPVNLYHSWPPYFLSLF